MIFTEAGSLRQAFQLPTFRLNLVHASLKILIFFSAEGGRSQTSSAENMFSMVKHHNAVEHRQPYSCTTTHCILL